MEVETTHKFDGDAKVSEVAEFLRERHVSVGWGIDGEATEIGGYSSGMLRLEFVEEFETSDDE